MDRINKFIDLKPTKKSRYIRHEKKNILVTKSDVKKVRSFRLNKCMDPSIDLYTPNNTEWSRKVAETGIKEKKRKINNDYQTKNYIERITKDVSVKKIKKDPFSIKDIWEDDELETNFVHKVNTDLISRNCIFQNISNQRFEEKCLKTILKNLENEYFVPKIKQKEIIDFLPTIPDKHNIKNVPEDIAKSYIFDQNIKDAMIDTYNGSFGVSFGNLAEAYEFRNVKNIFKVDSIGANIQNFLVNNEMILYSINNKVFIYFYRTISFNIPHENDDCDLINGFFKKSKNTFIETDENEKQENKKEKIGWENLKKESNDRSVFIKKIDENKIIIEHKNKIKKISLSHNKKILCVITAKSIILHDIINYKSSQPLKLQTEIPLQISMFGYKLLVSTTNNFIVYNLKKRKTEYDFPSTLSYVHTFSANKKYTVLADRYNRITIIKEGDIIKNMEQNNVIREIILHSKLEIFIVVFENHMSLFYGRINEISKDFECVIIKEFVGRYKCVYFHDDLPWIYAVQKNKIVLFT